MAIYKLERVGGSVDRLERALEKLEQALIQRPTGTTEDADGAAAMELRDRLTEAEQRYDRLKATTDEVSARLDGAIARVETLLKA